MNVLKAMYTNLKSCVKLQRKSICSNDNNTQSVEHAVTNWFSCNIGTRQGDKTSSTIFTLFIDELSAFLRENCGSGIFVTNQIPDIICLMFADDIANCAETKQKLQEQINLIEIFCQNSGMEVNLNKTEITVFRNGGVLKDTERWYFRGKEVNTTPVYKYMGLIFTPSLSWKLALDKLAAQAQKAIFSVNNFQRPFGYFQPFEMFKIFDSMIKPILCYGSQVLGYEYVHAIETVHTTFCKKFLQLNKNTNNCIVLGECGRHPLCVNYFTNCISYWCNLLQMPTHRYPRNCYLLLKSLDDAGRICWASKIRNLLFTDLVMLG